MSGQRHTYDYAVDTEADTAGAHVLKLVGDARRVLEIGAGPGSITRELARGGGRELAAVELDPTAIEKLKSIVPHVYPADLNDPQWQQVLQPDARFDAVVSADVLEHLLRPWDVLAGLKALLAPGGHVVVSLPHVGHHGVVACLLDEDFEYRDWGLLDRTHIRFFGLKNVQTLFDAAGFRVVDVEVVVRPPERSEFARRWSRLPPATRAAIEAANPFGCVYQVIVKAGLPSSEPSIALLDRVRDRIGERAQQRGPLRVALKEWLRGRARAMLSDRALRQIRFWANRLGLRT